jgi:hypothetical protein
MWQGAGQDPGAPSSALSMALLMLDDSHLFSLKYLLSQPGEERDVARILDILKIVAVSGK